MSGLLVLLLFIGLTLAVGARLLRPSADRAALFLAAGVFLVGAVVAAIGLAGGSV